MVEEASEIPTDLVFVIVEEGKREEDSQEVMAHRFVMGLVSVVFTKMLFVSDTKDKTTGRVLVRPSHRSSFLGKGNGVLNLMSYRVCTVCPHPPSNMAMYRIQCSKHNG